MSQSSVALVHQVIPLFDGITRALDNHAKDPKNKPAVCMAAAQSRIMLDKYYGLTDDSVVYWIAMRRPCQLSLSCCQLTHSGWCFIHVTSQVIFRRLVNCENLEKEWNTTQLPKDVQ
jgi:hypothetical protein